MTSFQPPALETERGAMPTNPQPVVPDANKLRKLADYENSSYSAGRGLFVQAVWYFVSLLIFESGWFPVSRLKTALLRFFGASIGRGVVIHPNVRIKYPWRLSVGDNCWVGRQVWIDNLDDVLIESDVCISQDAYLCTGSHDHRSSTFELKTGSIRIQHGAWICCRATVLGGTTVPSMLVVAAGEVFATSEPDAKHTYPRKPR